MTGRYGRPSGVGNRFFGSWRRALGELAVVALGVLIALWADQAMQAREDASIDLLTRTLLSAGSTPAEIAKVIATAS